MERTVRRRSPPDGGYGWFVLLSTFLVFGLTFGVIKAFGVFYMEINRHFATTATEASWITSISVATVHIGAPLGAALSERYSHRAVVMLGGLLTGLGMVGGSFSQSLFQLYVTAGFLTGLGYALTWTPTVTILGHYFSDRRPLANGLSSAGECVFTFVATPAFQLMVDWFSWRGAMLLLGGLELNLCVCGALLRPLGPRGAPVEGLEEEGRAYKEEAGTVKPVKDYNPGVMSPPTPLRVKLLHYVDYTLIGERRFIVYSLFGVFAALGFFAPALFLVPYARSRGVEEYSAAALMSISAAADLAGRVACGWLANLRLMETVKLLIITVTLLGGVLLLCPLAASFASLAAFSVAYGLTFGATVAIHITVLAEVVGVERLGSALSFFMLLRSSGGLLGPPIAGVFIDRMGDYGAGFLMAGVALITSALFLLLLHHMNKQAPGASKLGQSARTEEDGLE